MLLGDERAVKVSLPDRGVVTVTRQQERSIVHLLFAHTTVRGRGVEVIEDATPLYDVEVSLKLDKAPERVYLAPEGAELKFVWENGRARFTVPKVVLHQMVVAE